MNIVPQLSHIWQTIRIKSQYILARPWLTALVLFGIFMMVNGYHFGWDDQHLEVPLLKHLIDPELYAGDYYVESLQENFTSFFYLILAKLITVEQIEPIYFLLYLISRYFLIYWLYKLWLVITERDYTASAAAVLVFLLMSRVHEFLYRTFSHQEFALAMIFAGIYYFFRNRFYLAAFILGVAANIHALYSLFPMTYICLYLLWQIRKRGWKPLIFSGLIFTFSCFPFLIWTFYNRFAPDVPPPSLEQSTNWLSMYITACPQNFFYPQVPQILFHRLFESWTVFFELHQQYIYIALLFILNLTFHRSFRNNKKALAFCGGGFFYLLLCYVYTYLWPNQFMLDLNLCRNTQYLLFLLSGFTTWLFIRESRAQTDLVAWMLIIIFSLMKYHHSIAIPALTISFCLMVWGRLKTDLWWHKLVRVVLVLLMIILSFQVLNGFNSIIYSVHVWQFILFLFVLMIGAIIWMFVNQYHCRDIPVKRYLIWIPLLVYMMQFGVYHYQKWQSIENDEGFWRLQKNWEDMQLYVKYKTPKDAMVLVPYNMEMGGFRIRSERKIVCSYRDCGIVGFDYGAALEWMQRVKDIHAFTYNIQHPLNSAIQNAVKNYGANYIVFMRYAKPKDIPGFMRMIYINQDFALFEVEVN